MPLTTIVITTYRRPQTLVRAIHSAIGQVGSRVEVIVVDDNSSGDEARKETETLMRQFSGVDAVRYIKHEKNSNGASARNTGIANAKGDYITFLDDDDVFMPTRIASCVKILEADGTIDCVYTDYILARQGRIVKISEGPMYDDSVYELLRQNAFFGTGSNFVCRINQVNSIGGFDPGFNRHQDVEFMIRFCKEFKLSKIHEPLVVKNIDSTINMPRPDSMEDTKKRFLEKFKAIIDGYETNEKNDIYRANYLELAKIFAWHGVRPSNELSVKIESYGKLSFAESVTLVAKKLLAGTRFVEMTRYYLKHLLIVFTDRRQYVHARNELKTINEALR